MRITIQRNGVGDGGARRPIYQQIAEQVKEAISTGQLRRGEKLPTIRALAGELGVNRDTVALAYDGLARDGIVETTVGRGTFVRQTAAGRQPAEQVAPPLSPVVERLIILLPRRLIIYFYVRSFIQLTHHIKPKFRRARFRQFTNSKHI